MVSATTARATYVSNCERVGVDYRRVEYYSNQMTSQEIFDTVAAHLLKQGKRALRSGLAGASCVYRATDGCKCAVGCVIPDEFYEGRFEHHGVRFVLEESQELYRLLGGSELLLNYLQRIHDCEDVQKWPSLLKACADRPNIKLSSAVVDTCERAPGIDWVA